MAEKDKMKALNQLKKKEAEMEQTLKTQNELQSQMATIEQKFIFGGVNLLEKDEEQLKLLEESNKEIETKLTQQSEMRKKIVETEVTLDDINKKYTSLQEEAQAKTRKLKKSGPCITRPNRNWPILKPRTIAKRNQCWSQFVTCKSQFN